MAVASVAPALPPLRVFKNDPHWMKFKAVVATSDAQRATLFLVESYSDKEIGEKLDQFLFELIDAESGEQLRCLSSAMKAAHKTTEFSRVARLGAAILLKETGYVAVLKYRSPSLPSRARTYAQEFRQRGWESRACFMDRVASS